MISSKGFAQEEEEELIFFRLHVSYFSIQNYIRATSWCWEKVTEIEIQKNQKYGTKFNHLLSMTRLYSIRRYIKTSASSLVGIIAGFQISASVHHQIFRFVATAVDVVHLMTDGGAITGAWQIQDLILDAGTALTSATGFTHWNPVILNSTPVDPTE